MTQQHIYFYYPNQPYAEFMNFYRGARFKIGDKWYETVEHWFQANKSIDTSGHEQIRLAKTPKEAKELGRKIKLRADWEQVKEDIMLQGLRAKFNQHSRLKQLLLSTGDARLHEDSPHDKYWGIKGRDRLGALLEVLRDELKGEA